jgi:hypothetical protein
VRPPAAAPGAARPPAQPPAASPGLAGASTEQARSAGFGGYLGPDRLPDDALFLPAHREYRSASRTWRFFRPRGRSGRAALESCDGDDKIDRRSLLADFRCARHRHRAQTPAITRVLQRSNADLFAVVGAAEDRYQRARPFLTSRAAASCRARFAKSGSYPSGHAAGVGYTRSCSPDRPRIPPRSWRAAIGESRVVCGVRCERHRGGRLAATLVATLPAWRNFRSTFSRAPRARRGSGFARRRVRRRRLRRACAAREPY